MTFIQILAILRNRWSAIVVGLLVGVAAAAVTTAVLPPSYASTTSIYVRATDTGAGATSYTSNLLTQQLVNSYADLATSQRVLNAVIQELGLNRSADDLASHVDAAVQQNSTILDLTVTDRSPTEAARLAQAVGTQLSAAVTQIEQAGSYSVEFSVVDRPVVDDHAVSPRWQVNLAVGAVLGLLLGVVLAAVWSATDQSVRTTSALAAAAGARALAAVPNGRPGRRGLRRSTGSSEFGDSAEFVDAVRRLRTGLQLAERDGSPIVATLVGPRAGIGTSTVVRALAAAAAPTRRVLLVEGDLQKPTAAVGLGLDPAAGLDNVLAGDATLASAVQQWRGVDVLTAGAPVEDSTALLVPDDLRRVLDAARASYDLVLIDAPPLGPALDGLLFARASDLTVLTARAAATPEDDIAAAAETLRAEGVHILGTVLTFASGRAHVGDRARSGSLAPVGPVASQPSVGGVTVPDPA